MSYKIISIVALVVVIATFTLSAQPATIAGTPNTYVKVLETGDCSNTIIVGDVDGMDLAENDRVLIIQMKGGVVSPLDQDCCPNDQTAGSVLHYNAAGNFEFATVDDVEALTPVDGHARNRVTLKNSLKNLYEAGLWGRGTNGVQLVKVPMDDGELYDDLEIAGGGVTVPVWNDGGSYVGGVLALEITGTLTITGNIDVGGKGFQGGKKSYINHSDHSLRDRVYPEGDRSGYKGEGIDSVFNIYSAGRGWVANGGGGGNADGAGGGGGGNYGIGGAGGNQASNSEFDPDFFNGGEGGEGMAYADLGTRAFLGGGGGGGHAGMYTMCPTCTDPSPTCIASAGGIGGGIVIIRAAKIVANGGNIIADGADADDANNAGAGGGGAGGSVLLSVPAFDITPGHVLGIFVRGGKGGDANQAPLGTFPSLTSPPACFGPGGGGGGGLVWFSGTTPALTVATVTKTGGSAGLTVKLDLTHFACSEEHREATDGSLGATQEGLLLPGDPLP